ncbi:sphingomyelin synthase related [Tachypleus tridentatus]|uniref:sphingomyelin synthase related n=1 Tax=Tachypleus tridentatus TaxID=6853 RepID=UPI003FD538B4
MTSKAGDWNVRQVAEWLDKNGFEAYIPLFCDKHKIDGKALLVMTELDLKQPPLELQVLGDIKRLSIAISKLKRLNQETLDDIFPLMDQPPSVLPFSYQGRSRRRRRRYSSESPEHFIPHRDNSTETDGVQSFNKKFKPEIWKTIVAMIYFLAVTWITAITMVIVHDRVPDMKTYPPLPDIFLDNMPFIPWAFGMCEFTGIVLSSIWITIMIFHKHRFILLRRMFSLFGSVFLLRCITMLITSLSVPGTHLDCQRRLHGNWSQKLHEAFMIWEGVGMSIKGVRTCGDYMFSGHTAVLTLLNFFITEYSPRTLYFLHTTTWVLNLFGIFFILAAHEHYSIDVFVAFYITTRLFLYYHTLANNRALMQDDGRRARIWFPLFTFFEDGVDGIVPNEYEWPFKFPENLRISIWPNKRKYSKTF